MKVRSSLCCLLLCGLFAALLGLKVEVIHRFGSDLPFMDQWAREGDMLIAPAREGTFHWKDLLVPHSEHRIVPTLALNLGLALASGQWDARVECVVNAVIHSALMVLFAAYVFRAYSPGAAIAAGWLQLGLILTALDYENTLTGFQSVFYFVLGFSILAIWALLDPRGWTAPRWWGGLLCGGLAMVSLGSGLLCFAPVAAIAAYRLGAQVLGREARPASPPEPWRRREVALHLDLVTLCVAVAALVAGWLTRGDAPWEIPVHAKSLSDFLLYFLHCLAWPASKWTAVAALAWLPWLYFALRNFGRYTERQQLLLAAGLWVLLQIAAVSFYRGAGGTFPASRYADIFVFGLLVNLVALVEGAERWRRWPRLSWMMAAAWLAILAPGAVINGLDLWRNLLPSVEGRSRVYEENVGLYLRTGDVSRLNPPHIIPFPSVDWFKRMIDRPALRAVLPASVRSPAYQSALSAAVRHFCRAGIWLFWGGIVLLLGAGALTWRQTG